MKLVVEVKVWSIVVLSFNDRLQGLDGPWPLALGSVNLSWNDGVIDKVDIDTELWVSVGSWVLLVLERSVQVVVGNRLWGVNNDGEVLAELWLDGSRLGVWVWVPVSVVEVNFVNVVVTEVSVVASVGPEVVLDVVAIVDVGVAFWVRVDLSEVAELWRLVLGWSDVLDLSVGKTWLSDLP